MINKEKNGNYMAMENVIKLYTLITVHIDSDDYITTSITHCFNENDAKRLMRQNAVRDLCLMLNCYPEDILQDYDIMENEWLEDLERDHYCDVKVKTFRNNISFINNENGERIQYEIKCSSLEKTKLPGEIITQYDKESIDKNREVIIKDREQKEKRDEDIYNLQEYLKENGLMDCKIGDITFTCWSYSYSDSSYNPNINKEEIIYMIMRDIKSKKNGNGYYSFLENAEFHWEIN